LRDEVTHLLQHRVEARDEGRVELDAVLLAGGDHRLRIRDVGRQRLLAQHMDTPRRGQLDERPVPIRCAADDGCSGLAPLEEPLGVRVEIGAAGLLGERPAERWRLVIHTDQAAYPARAQRRDVRLGVRQVLATEHDGVDDLRAGGSHSFSPSL
jgi:hypothetical protein